MHNTEQKEEINHYYLSSGKFRLDGGAMFGIIPKPLWNKHAPANENNAIELDLRLWLIKTPTRNILVDTGIGTYHGDKFNKVFDVIQDPTPLNTILKQADITPQEITDLVITHLHFDHVGGLVSNDGSGFVDNLPNATIHLHKKHYEYAKSPSTRDAGSFHQNIFVPVIERAIKEERIHWLESPEGTILELSEDRKLSYLTSNGHTPSMIHPYCDGLIYLADIVPTSAHIPVPWVMAYDISPVTSTEDKGMVLKFIEEQKMKIIFEHDPKYWGATIKKNDKNHYVANELFETCSSGIEEII